ncbi:MAG TPA: four helix bundle protein [Gemmatimonadaceae bacterium]|nr:four helix bundle protein [Gemmatimonadaceae bacterium]
MSDLSNPSHARNCRDLIAWQRAFALADHCPDVADGLSPRYPALADQIRRSAVSVASNIAEGNGRLSIGDYLRVLRMAHGSLRELETQLLLAQSRHPDGAAAVSGALAAMAEVGRLLGGLTRSLRRLRNRGTDGREAPASTSSQGASRKQETGNRKQDRPLV